MSELVAFAQLGFRHIVDVNALDHVVFLVALAAIYRFRDLRSVLWVVTAFTVGHSVTLALAVTGALELPSALIEFLIPVTIVITGIENIVLSGRAAVPWRGRYRPVLAGTFGLVHGAGFANYLKALFVEDLAMPLLGFNLGIEAGQLVVLAVAATLLLAMDAIIGRLGAVTDRWPAMRLRTVSVSLLVVAVGSLWAADRAPW
jgi:hypothetical protein